eukprot:447275-Amphidinium_carterae.1
MPSLCFLLLRFVHVSTPQRQLTTTPVAKGSNALSIKKSSRCMKQGTAKVHVVQHWSWRTQEVPLYPDVLTQQVGQSINPQQCTRAVLLLLTPLGWFELFRRVADAAGVQVFPLSGPCVAAVLRKVDYRSAQQVLVVAVKHHRRECGHIDKTLAEVFKDCRRALNRSLGPRTRAPEIRGFESGVASESVQTKESAWSLTLTLQFRCVCSDGNFASYTLAQTNQAKPSL